MKRPTAWLILIVALTAVAVWFVVPSNDQFLGFQLHPQPLGLDVVGGLRVLLAADLPADVTIDASELQQTANNVAKRVNALGLGEATIQTQGSRRILVELPGESDPQRAIETIQETALLEFVDFAGLRDQISRFEGRRIHTQLPQPNPCVTSSFTQARETSADTALHPFNQLPFQTVMTGACLSGASAIRDPQRGQWEIAFELQGEAVELFAEYTARHIGEPMAIVLDGWVLSAPIINSAITNGEGIITLGIANTPEEAEAQRLEAQQLALQLRSGALPIPLRVESTQIVGATLGQDSVARSVRAGIVGIIVVLLFMLIYYRLPGLAAALALLVFMALNLASYRILPVTLTLPAITGFLISVGTAVDGNILIFERIKEELRAGQPLSEALEMGFSRAWSAILTSNLSTILIATILFLFGQTPGAHIVSGFALTLIIGLSLNLFTAVLVTRTFLSLFITAMNRTQTRRVWLWGA
ncbi:MAG: protein translocase subunit SecD [Anaerolineaceae bacterium]|nr:protein translocase subunit SecD [Anaerolineaceae bacterium]MCY4105480.1 protein translocase subunit SecD [Chloroflexota bacterium]